VVPPIAVIVAVVVGRWYRAAVGAPAAIAVAGGGWVVLPVAVVVAMVVGGRCPPAPSLPLWGPPLPSPSQVVGGASRCHGRHCGVPSPSQVVGGASHCRRCHCCDGGWAMPPDAIITVVSPLWWSHWRCLVTGGK